MLNGFCCVFLCKAEVPHHPHLEQYDILHQVLAKDFPHLPFLDIFLQFEQAVAFLTTTFLTTFLTAFLTTFLAAQHFFMLNGFCIVFLCKADVPHHPHLEQYEFLHQVLAKDFPHLPFLDCLLQFLHTAFLTTFLAAQHFFMLNGFCCVFLCKAEVPHHPHLEQYELLHQVLAKDFPHLAFLDIFLQFEQAVALAAFK
jgi:uncharacterized protein (DUF433 family)